VPCGPETLDRTVQPSGRFLAQVIKGQGVPEESYAAYVADEVYPTG
jgi:hypothetical protein